MKSLGFALFCLLCTVAYAEDGEDEAPQQIAFSAFTATDTNDITTATYAVNLNNRVNWYTAELLCRAEGFTLVSIPSSEEQEAIEMFLSSLDEWEELGAVPIWTSGSNHGVNSKYIWYSTGKEIYTNQFLISPPTRTTRCIGYNPNTSNWSNHDCREERYFLCQKATAAGEC